MRKTLEAIKNDPVRTVFIGAFGVSLAAAGVATVAVVGCDRPGGEAVPLDGTATTAGLCVGPCFADPGSGPVSCAVAAQVDTLPIESFDNFQGSTALAAEDWYSYTDGTAHVWFTNYVGGLSDAGYQPAVAKPDPSILPCQPNSPYPADSGTPFSPGVLHAFGGPFLGWGGGMGITMQKVNGRDPENSQAGSPGATPYYINVDTNGGANPQADPNAPKNVCCNNGSTTTPTNRPQGCTLSNDPNYAAVCPPVDGGEFAVVIATLDVSAYEGVSFWARRGTDGQTGIRVNIGDKYTDDDINYLAQRQQATDGVPEPIYCRRNRECDCLNHQTCELVSGQTLADAGNTIPGPPSDPNFTPGTLSFFCGVPQGLDLASGCGSGYGLSCVGLNGGPFTCCDQTNCQQPYPGYPCDLLPNAGPFTGSAAYANGDPQYYNATCTPYAFDNGISGSYCFNPGTDPPPAPPTELCGDFWMTTVDLSTNWQFYQVPFTVLHQQGFAKKSEHLDLHSVSTIRFTWDIGPIDYWLDQVSFYRHTTSPPPH